MHWWWQGKEGLYLRVTGTTGRLSFYGRPAIVIATIVLVVTLVVTSWLTLEKIHSDIRIAAGAALTTVLDTTHQALLNWGEVNRRDTQVWAKTEDVLAYVNELLAVPPTKDALLSSPALENLRKWLHPIHTGKGFKGFTIIGPGNINIASSRNKNLGMTNVLATSNNFLEKIWKGETGLSLPLPSNIPLPDYTGKLVPNFPTMFVAAPIKNKSGNVVSLLTFRIDPGAGFTDILQRGRIGETGETYAFDNAGHLISESRFDHHLREIGLIAPNHRGILHVEIRDPGVDMTQGKHPGVPRTQQPLTRMAASATTGENAQDLNGYRDYRGVMVIGAWLWDATLGMGITTEIDIDEIYKFQRATRTIFILFTIIAIATLISLAFVYEKSWKNVLEREKQVLIANRAKSDLLANMSHELRTPLNAIIGFSSTMKEEIFGPLSNERYREYLEDIHHSGEHLLAIINDILDVSAVEAGALEMNEGPVALSEAITASLRIIRPKAEVASVSLKSTINADVPKIHADERRVKQVFLNLLSNAVKFTPEGGNVCVSSKLNSDGSLAIIVADTGMGMDNEEMKKAMSKFGQVDSGLSNLKYGNWNLM